MAMTSSTIFTYQGLNRRGLKVKGEISAVSVVEAKNQLRRQGISAKKVKKLNNPLFAKRGEKIKAADMAVLSRQIATMLGAGVTLIQTIEMIASGHENVSMRKLLNDVAASVKAGNPLSSTLRKQPNYFDDLYCDLVKTGEQSGTLETIYERIAIYLEKAEALKSKIKKAMFYPVAVLVVACVVTIILLIFVVPQFEQIFASFGAELPVFTQWVLAISRFLQHYGLFVGGGVFIFTCLFARAYKRTVKLRDSVDAKLLRLPVIGDILKKASVARFTRTLATTFAAGVPLIGALDSAAGAAGNAVFRDAILIVKKEVSSGIQMNVAMNITRVFPAMVVQMVAIGEEAGAVDEMLSKIASIYEAEVDDMVDGLTSLLEPLIMAVLGLVIGGLIVAMYLPIFEMGNVI
ncbi:type II secretion system F family protein [Paraglaciecola aquimarina]|uniref:Type II secretion system F family protein n=1 Tax=Paraglaciecola aquimarina TaxID=1235557 RepID=A0ABU3SWD8_9ALTE|nr:type II secretion system F family protein [Paraglaciecola aquimarina]MDU0354302.1 type II secretion system F family protein [Paraglaciecola aquimarina]